MAELKTKKPNQNPLEVINSISDETKRSDSMVLLELFKKITKEKPVMWGTSIIGFGEYHYKSERSSQEGDWPLVGFAARKQSLTLYIMSGFEMLGELLKKLGKHKTSSGCLYINKLADVNLEILEEIIKRAFDAMKKRNTVK